MILKILLGVVVLYLLVGAVISYVALSYMNQSGDHDFVKWRQRWENYGRWQKFKSVCLGLVIWLPAALGIKRSHFFK
jgi:hypothetical protein